MEELARHISTRRCLLCHPGRVKKNDTLHWHMDPDTGALWVYCVGVCQRGYSIEEYTAKAGLSLAEFLKQDFDIREAPPNEVNKMAWPVNFVPLFDSRAKIGLSYLNSRNIEPDQDLFYDIQRKGIVFPYSFHDVFCGAQIRLIEPWIDKDGNERKVDTLPGTRLGLLFYGWNQKPLPAHVTTVVVTEGAFNSISIQQALNTLYGGIHKSKWRCVALSGSGASKHHIETLRELKDNGTNIVVAPDSDSAGVKMFRKIHAAGAATHYAFTDDQRIDWNDARLTMNNIDYVKWFFSKIRKVT